MLKWEDGILLYSQSWQEGGFVVLGVEGEVHVILENFGCLKTNCKILPHLFTSRVVSLVLIIEGDRVDILWGKMVPLIYIIFLLFSCVLCWSMCLVGPGIYVVFKIVYHKSCDLNPVCENAIYPILV